MAEGGAAVGGINELFNCPVCFHQYRNPRILTCGHHFCEECINQIAERNSDGNVPCPTCRKLTELSLKVTVTDLPRPVILNELQEKIGSLLSVSTQGSSRFCDVCKNQSKSAATRCQECATNMCMECMTKHQKITAFANHKAITITEWVFCVSHSDAVVTMYCTDCKMGCCQICAIGGHSNHSTKYIQDLVLETREKLTTFSTAPPPPTNNKLFLTRVKAAVKSKQEKLDSMNKNIRELKEELSIFQTELTNVETELKENLQSDLSTSKLESTMDGIDSSRKNLTDLAKYLLNDASDIELVIRGQEFPSASVLTDTLSSFTVRETVVAGNLEKMVSDVRAWRAQCKIFYNSNTLVDIQDPSIQKSNTSGEKNECATPKHGRPTAPPDSSSMEEDVGLKPIPMPPLNVLQNVAGASLEEKDYSRLERNVPMDPGISVTPFERFRRDRTIYVGSEIEGLCISNINNVKNIVVRTHDDFDPIKVYDYYGRRLRSYFDQSCGVEGIKYDGTSRSLTMDTKRILLLVARKGSIARLDQRGHLIDSIYLEGGNLRGITYLVQEDVYAVSDSAKKSVGVVIIDPNTKDIVTEFGSLGRMDTEFYWPRFLSYLNQNGKTGIVVCDSGNDQVKLFDATGQHVKTYGDHGSDEGDLDDPWDVCVDPAGRILVCDFENKRVASCWTSRRSGQETWRRLLTFDDLGGRPVCIDIDPEERLLFVATDEDVVHVFQCTN